MLRQIDFKLLMAEPEDGGSGSVVTPTEESSKARIEALWDDDDDEALDLAEADDKGPSSEETKEETTEETESEADEVSDELESELTIDEGKLELIEPIRRAEILKAFPEVFKKFPYLEHAYYRDQAYTEVFATPKDAVEASEKAQALDNFEQTLYSGDIKTVLESVKNDDPNAFNKIVDNMMVALGEIDENVQVHVIRNIGVHLRDLMLQESNTSGNEALKHAAVLLNQFISGSSKPAEMSRISKEEVKRDETLDRERREFQQERHNTVRDTVITRLDKKITNTLVARLDPNESMTEFVRDAALGKAKRLVQQNIAADSRFKKVMEQAWTRAVKNGYRKEDVELINKSYENKAAALLPSIITKVRSEAMKGSTRRLKSSTDDEVITREPQKRGPVAPGRSTTPSNSGRTDARGSAKAAQAKGLSVKQFLMQD